ncbi:MAG TPA: AAA family ATPase [Ktedonobacteraceae bacterium]|nr:AAA family ATPase [Ktedonobacteraceae bacterium]
MGSFSSPVICPVLVGRALERDALLRLVERTRSGQGQIALVCGEAGVGKSRLVAGAKACAAAQDFLLLQGSCFQMDSSYPYAPLLDLLRASYAPNPLVAKQDPIVIEFARLLPEWTPSLPGPLIASLLDPEQEKRRLFAALTRFFKERTAQQPVLLVIEDLHWCDDISLEFLQSLARLCPTQPLLLLMTYRSDEVQPGLQRFLAQLARARLSQELQLTPLSRSDVDAMLSAMFVLREDEQAALLGLIYPLTEGNPFFVEEILTSLVSRGELWSDEGIWQRKPRTETRSEQLPVPRSVQDAVQERTHQLSVEAMQVVTFAAVAGRRFDFAVLQQVMRCDEERLLQLIKELLASQLVVEVSAEQFAFRHALTQQAVYTGLLARERRLLHRTLAEAIEHLYATTPMLDAHLEDLAYHYYQAGVWEKALEYAQRVGEKALALYAPQAAIDHFTQALSALHHLPAAWPAAVYHLRGQAYETLGEFERAQGDYERALEAARAAQDRLMEWQSMKSLGFLWTGRDYAQAGVWFHHASDLAEDLADSVLRAHSLNQLGNWLQNTGRIQEALEAHQEALRLFEARADRQGMAQTLEMLGMAHFFTGDPASGVKDFFGRVIDLYRDMGDRQSLFPILAARAIDSAPETIETTFSSLRTRDECAQDLEEALRLARQTNSQSGQAFVELATSLTLSSFGEFSPALAHAQEALRIATTIEHQEWLTATYGALGQAYLLLLEPSKAASHLETALAGAQALGSAIWTKQLTPYLALAYILKREFPRAEAVLKPIMPREQQPRDFFERQAARAWGELALAQGKPAVALFIAEQLIASAPGDARPQPIPHLLALKGEALIALKCLEEAAGALEDARLGAEQRQAPSILWHIHRSLGQAYHLLKREDRAQHEWSAARDIINRLAATIDETPLQEHFLRSALSSFPQAKPLSQEALTSNMYDGLSAREREVAALVARGKSNREIATALVVSERTAEAHVSNILGKLGFTTRAQIAAWAVEKGLTTTR